MSDDNPEYTPDVAWIDPQSCYYELEQIDSDYVAYMRVSIHDERMAAALARAEAAEAEAAALRARVAELEAEHYALRQQLITAAQAALPGDVTITRMTVGWTDRLTGPQHIVLIDDEEE